MSRVKNILKGIKYISDCDLSGTDAKRVTDDSRKVKRNDIFIAAKGYKTDGYKFIGQAIKNGAGIIISDRDFKATGNVKKIIVQDARACLPIIAENFYGNPSGQLKVVGVTGTNGKTTITYLLEHILNTAGKRSGVIGTISYRVCGKEMPAANTTPGALELQSLFANMIKNRAGYAIMEVSSHSLDQGRVERISFDAAIFTNLTKEHLDYHGTMGRYFNAKSKLFKKLKDRGIAILNNDDKMVASLKKRIKNRVITYGIKNIADVTAKNIRLTTESSVFFVKTPRGSFNINTRLIGRHNISNVLASIAASIALGISIKAVKKGIESFGNVPGRLESVDVGQPFRVLVDYAHTEDALYNVLSLLRGVTGSGRIITVFGCGGNRDRAKRPLMGSVACRFSDHVVVTSDNPRLEDPMFIISEIENGIQDKFSNYDVAPDRKDAITKALRMAREGDVVVLAGKGHEKYQIINDRMMPFDDVKVASSILKAIL